jgi:hypothetical protein
MSDPTPTRALRDAIEQALFSFEIGDHDIVMYDAMVEEGDKKPYTDDEIIALIANAVLDHYAALGIDLRRRDLDQWELVRKGKPKSLNELLYNAEADAVIAEQNEMIAHVHSVTGYEPDMGGNGKWESAIKYLVRVKKENGWDIATLWKMMHETETVNGREQAKYWAFEPGRISYGTLMTNPHEMLKLWMPRAYADAIADPKNDGDFQMDENGMIVSARG